MVLYTALVALPCFDVDSGNLMLSKPEKFDVETIEPSDITAGSSRHDTRTMNLALVQ